MSRPARVALAVTSGWLVAASASAATISFTLDGSGGSGLLGANENGPIVGNGEGGILGGISLDTDTNELSIDVGWGQSNGFIDLTGNATAGHIHGATASPAPAGFSQNAGVLVTLSTLTGWDPSATSGGFGGTVTLTDAQETLMLANRTYINIHTTEFPGGEMRGHLVVPEPSTALLLVVGLAAFALPGRRV